MSAWEAAGKSNDWFTPSYVFDALGERFELDVAAPVQGIGTTVPARQFLSEDSLNRPWHGFIWMNPPFSERRNGVQPWLEKFFAHGNGIALTADRTSAPWFRYAWSHADAVLFTPKIRFVRPDGKTGNSPGNGTALWASGARATQALMRAGANGLGIVATPITNIVSVDRRPQVAA